jgi:hypothetical protein
LKTAVRCNHGRSTAVSAVMLGLGNLQGMIRGPREAEGMDAYSNRGMEEAESLMEASLGLAGTLHPGGLAYLGPAWVEIQSALVQSKMFDLGRKRKARAP